MVQLLYKMVLLLLFNKLLNIMIKLRDLLPEKIIGGRSELYPEKSDTHIVAAAWIDPIGDIYTGDDHFSAAINAADSEQEDAKLALRDRDDFYRYLRKCGWNDGFLTSAGDWVSREDAMVFARKAQQMKNDKHIDRVGLDSYDIR